MKRLILGVLILFLAIGTTVSAKELQQMQIQFVDEFGRNVDMGTSVSIYIYDVGTSDEKTCYMTRAGLNSCTQPITDDSTNTPLNYSQGLMTFWITADSYKITVTDGTYTRTLDNRTGSFVPIGWPTYLNEMTGSTYGQNDDIDFSFSSWIIDGDTSVRLDMIPDGDGGILAIGSTTANSDVYIYGSATDYIFFDEGNKLWNMVDIDMLFDDDAKLLFGTGSDIQFLFDNSGDDLDITGSGSEIAFGADDEGMDIYWHTENTGDNVFFDETNAELFFTDVDIQFDDDGDLIFGTGNDWVIDSDTAKTLDFIPATTDETSAVNIGANTAGADFKIFGATTGEHWMYDASLDKILANTGLALYTMTDAVANQFKIDATGTVAGNAIVFETTDGGVQINADGASNGDIAVDAADDITLTAAGDLTLAVTGTVSAGGSAITNALKPVEVFSADDTLTAAESGKVCVSIGLTGAGAGDLTLTLPPAAAGLTYTFIDVNAVAADDLWITCGAGDTINGGTAAKSYKCTGDAVKQHLTIVAQDATSWLIIAEDGTWANDNN